MQITTFIVKNSLTAHHSFVNLYMEVVMEYDDIEIEEIWDDLTDEEKLALVKELVHG